MSKLADRFITPVAVTRAQQRFNRITYTHEAGIRKFMSQLHMITHHIMMPVDEYTLHNRIVKSIPTSIWNHLIDFKGLSTTTSLVVEWVQAIEDWEYELQERVVYDVVTMQKRVP